MTDLEQNSSSSEEFDENEASDDEALDSDDEVNIQMGWWY